MNEPDNHMQWDGISRGHYEVWYVTLNHRASNIGAWIRYTLESPHDQPPYAQIWFAFFDRINPQNTFGINQRFPISSLTANKAPFSVNIDDNTLTHQSASGALEGGGHSVRWDFRWSPNETTHRHLPAAMYWRGGLAETTVLTPSVNTELNGVIEVDGVAFLLSNEPGAQTHLWGRKHAHEWAWGHCNAFENHPEVALETLTIRLRKAGKVLPPITLLTLYRGDHAYRWTDLTCALVTWGDYGLGRYAFRATGRRVRVEGEYQCDPKHMVSAQYFDPDGQPAWCSNTEVADLRVRILTRSGIFSDWKPILGLTAPGTGHFEVATRSPNPAALHHHTEV